MVHWRKGPNIDGCLLIDSTIQNFTTMKSNALCYPFVVMRNSNHRLSSTLERLTNGESILPSYPCIQQSDMPYLSKTCEITEQCCPCELPSDGSHTLLAHVELTNLNLSTIGDFSMELACNDTVILYIYRKVIGKSLNLVTKCVYILH